MKIAVIIPQNKFFGGGPRLAIESAKEFSNQGHKPVIYTFQHGEDAYGYKKLLGNIPVITLDPSFPKKPKPLFGRPVRGFSELSQYFFDHKRTRALAEKISKDTEAILAHSNRSAYLVGYYFKRKVRNIPLVFQMNDVHLLAISKCRGKSRCSFAQSILYKVIDFFDSFLYFRHVDSISVLSEIIRKEALEYLGRNARVIRSGVNAEHFPYKERHSAPRSAKLLCHAQFFRHRRYEDAINALKILRDNGYDCTLTISGDSETYAAYRSYRDELKSQAAHLNIAEYVSFPGKLPDEKIVELFHESDIFICPHHQQSWGLVVFEAIASGLPAIVSKETGAHEVLTDSTNSILIPAREPRSIYEAVKKLIDNPDIYQTISRSGVNFVRHEMTWRRYADDIIKLFKT